MYIFWAALKFNILSANDGYSSLVQATQNITKHLMATGGSSDDIDIAMVDQFVHGMIDIAAGSTCD